MKQNVKQNEKWFEGTQFTIEALDTKHIFFGCVLMSVAYEYHKGAFSAHFPR